MALYAFDGTWNDSRAPESQRDTKMDTNVHQFRVLYGDGSSQVEYVDGVGSRYGIIGKLVGGLTGAGAKARISQLFEILKERYSKGDTEIDIVGYSRGAAIARMFVHRIEEHFMEMTKDGQALTEPPPVRFLGLFDTVGSFGVPWGENEGDFRPDIPDFVEHTFHAMALDETRESFGIERCLGNRQSITEVWFRGGHGDVGGNTTYIEHGTEIANRQRSDIPLNWMMVKAMACGLPMKLRSDQESPTNPNAHVTALDEMIGLGDAGTLSRRIHLGDLVHHTVEDTHLTKGIDGRLLRRIDIPTRIEDKEMEKSSEALFWTPPPGEGLQPDNIPIEGSNPSLVELSSRRYPFDISPARTWRSWLAEQMSLSPEKIGFDTERLTEFWAPTTADQELAWQVYVELATRISTRGLKDDEGNDKSALNSVYSLFKLSREGMRSQGPKCANAATLLTTFLNQEIRDFTAKWHTISIKEDWSESPGSTINLHFREELKALQKPLQKLASAMSLIADARL